MATDIGPKIGIQGEAQFRRELKNINTDLKTLGTETARVTSEFIGNEHSVEALTAANNALGAQSVSLAQKSQLLLEQIQKATDAYGSADARTQALTQAYNKNETQLNKTNAQIAANEKEIQQLTEAQNENADATGGLTGLMKTFGVDLDGVTKSLGLSKEQTVALSDVMGGGGLSLAAGAAAAAGAIALAAAAVKEITEFMADAVSSATDYADNINTLSTKFHIATEDLQAYQYMAELTDTSVDTITSSISKLTKSMDKARDGNEEVDKAFAALNIRVTDTWGNLRSANDVFLEAIDGLSRIHNETERDAVSMTLFGKSAMELNSLIAVGSKGINEFAQEARDMGYVLSDSDMAALQELDDQFSRLDNEMEAVKNQIAAEMAPALIDLARQLLDVAQTVDWREFGRAAGNSIRELTPMIVEMAQAVANAATALTDLIQLSQQARLISGNVGGTYGKDGYVSGGASARASAAPINLSVQLDSQTIARATYDANLAEANRRGTRAIK